VVVVSHNRAELLRRCLESLERAEARESFQTILVDNGSSDGSPQIDEEFTAVRMIRLPKNFGLTKALNIGIRAAEAEYILLLHDDTEVEPGVVRMLAETLDAMPEAAAVCPLLVDAGGAPVPQLGDLPPNGLYLPAAPGSGPVAVGYPRGAALMIRAFVFRSMRQIDERYGQFGGDAELAQQVRRGGKKILLVPAARVVHHGRESDTAMLRADFRLGRAAWIGKFQGFGAGLIARLGAVFQPLAAFQFGEFRYTVAGQKVDGTQS